jgi:hypothetical protein
MIFLYSKPMCSACIVRKKSLDDAGIPYEDRDGQRILEPEDEVDHEMFLKIAMSGRALTPLELPQEIEIK